MKIAYENDFVVTFSELKQGDCFSVVNRTPISTFIYMKLPEYPLGENEMNIDTINAVNLAGGFAGYFPPTTLVMKLKAKIIIEN